MAQLINLDDIVPQIGKVRYKGVDYVIPDIDMETYLWALKTVGEIGELPDDQAMERVVELMRRIVPDMPAEVVKTIGLKTQMPVLMAGIMQELQGSPNAQRAMPKPKK